VKGGHSSTSTRSATSRPIDEAASLVWGEPGESLAEATSRNPLTKLVRSVLRRALWPELAEQQRIAQKLVESVRALEGVTSTGLARLAAVEKIVRGAPDGLTGAIAESDEWLAQFDDQRELRLAEVERLVGPLRWQPYMADDRLRTTDAEGRPAIGYASGTFDQKSDSAVYRGFEDIFRGAEAFIRKRQRVYLDVIGSRQPVVDVGCGRGEFLDLLRERGLAAKGVDRDAAMVAHAAKKGHDVEQADLVDYLTRQPDESLGVVFCAQVIEHLEYEELLQFLRLSRRKLARDGLLIAETVNPHSLAAFKTFWVDLTHKIPIFPEVAVALCGLTGYDSAVVLFPNGRGELEADRLEQGEYAVIAAR
jgi:SAM-dependent methyltransferase